MQHVPGRVASHPATKIFWIFHGRDRNSIWLNGHQAATQKAEADTLLKEMLGLGKCHVEIIFIHCFMYGDGRKIEPPRGYIETIWPILSKELGGGSVESFGADIEFDFVY